MFGWELRATWCNCWNDGLELWCAQKMSSESYFSVCCVLLLGWSLGTIMCARRWERGGASVGVSLARDVPPFKFDFSNDTALSVNSFLQRIKSIQTRRIFDFTSNVRNRQIQRSQSTKWRRCVTTFDQLLHVSIISHYFYSYYYYRKACSMVP